MKTVFVVNPCAGKGKGASALTERIEKICAENNADYMIYNTVCRGDGERFVKEYCSTYGPARFIACGGDGTLGEVVNGVCTCPAAEVGVIPCGTGNDFCRNFDKGLNFTDVAAQLYGTAKQCDAIKYTVHSDDGVYERYCANMFNIGFDCNVADMTGEMKKKPFISGSLAYFISIFVMLIKKKGANLKLELDGVTKHEGKVLLTSIANGSYCGGGIKSNPLASLNDGNMDVNLVYNISRLSFLTKLPFYMKGTHTKLKNIERIIAPFKCKKAVVTPLDGKMRLCVDGEIYDAGKTEFEVVHNAFSFVVPHRHSLFLCQNTRPMGLLF